MNNDINDMIALLASTKTDDQLTEILSIKFNKPFNKAAVKKRRQRLGIKKAHGKGVCAVVSVKLKNDTQK